MNPEITWQRVEAANAQALQRMLAVQPAWVGVLRLSELIPDLDPMTLTHAGPPVTWSRMSGAERGGVIAAVLYEGWAKDPQTAAQLAEDGQVSLVPNHDLGGVGPMAGVLSPSMHVFVVQDRASGRRAYSSIEYDSLFGCWDERAMTELRQWNETLSVLARALGPLDELDLMQLMAQALMMGDELHSRQTASSAAAACPGPDDREPESAPAGDGHSPRAGRQRADLPAAGDGGGQTHRISR